jgi:hypothetical protein
MLFVGLLVSGNSKKFQMCYGSIWTFGAVALAGDFF